MDEAEEGALVAGEDGAYDIVEMEKRYRGHYMDGPEYLESTPRMGALYADVMRAAGVEIITDYSEVSVVGITEVLKRLPSLFRAMRRLVDEAERRRPPLAILTDFPGFHLRLARKLRPRGIRNIYYICPQFWAWRPWRVNLVRRRFSQALCIFHFEEKFY